MAPEDESRPPSITRLQPGLDPSADGVLVYAKTPRSFLHGIVSVDLDAPRIDPPHLTEPAWMRALMSSTRHAVIRGPSFTGFGYRPDFTPAHQVDRLTGIGPWGAMIDAKRSRPVFASTDSADATC